MSIETRISRLEENRPPTATAYIWLDEGESEDAAVARYCAARGSNTWRLASCGNS
jgi:hypothetical protein